MSELTVRALSGGVFVAVLITGILLGSTVFVPLLAIFSLIAASEFSKLIRFGNKDLARVFILGSVAFWCSAISWQYSVIDIDSVFGIAIFILLIMLVLVLFSKTPTPFLDSSGVILGFVYTQLGFLGIFLFGLSLDSTFNPNKVLFILILIWTNDTMAYLTGRAMGKNKLNERLSPKKTWEGTLGGAIASLSGAFILSKFIFHFDSKAWIMVGLVVSIFATLGDLFESMLKRNAGVKDAGNIIPGHGGILDRFDAALFAIPAAWAFILIFA